MPTYDLRGNMTSDGAVIYGYNANNLLTSVSAPTAATLVYDAENRLQSYTAGGTTTKFLYDGVDLIAEYDASNTLLRRYVHGPGDDEPLLWYDYTVTPSVKRFFVADERGSIVAVTNSAGVNLVMNTYNEYGVPTTTGSVPSRFGYTGQVWLPEISMAYYKARMYAPTLGRFLQTDPIGYGDGMNWYAYVHNDPMNGRDPTGTDSCMNFTFTHSVSTNGSYDANLSWSAPFQICQPDAGGDNYSGSPGGQNNYHPEYLLNQKSQINDVKFKFNAEALLTDTQKKNIRDNLKGLFPKLTNEKIDVLVKQISESFILSSRAATIGSITTKIEKGVLTTDITMRQYKLCVSVLQSLNSIESKEALSYLRSGVDNKIIKVM